jgi:hypothetical protein
VEKFDSRRLHHPANLIYLLANGIQLPLCEAVTLCLNSPHVRVVFKAFSGLSTSSPA